MRQMPSPENDLMLLQACAEEAGAALACSYSSSAEYEAALIAERRAAGRYGPRYRAQDVLIAASAVAAALALIILFLI
jgi:hypothetical protein